LKKAEASKKRETESVVSQYGKIPEEEYKRLLGKLGNDVEEMDSNLREDYEIWTNEAGLFRISYGCRCDVCGFAFEFEHEETLSIKEGLDGMGSGED